jgi:hypothetical protein
VRQQTEEAHLRTPRIAERRLLPDLEAAAVPQKLSRHRHASRPRTDVRIEVAAGIYRGEKRLPAIQAQKHRRRPRECPATWLRAGVARA